MILTKSTTPMVLFTKTLEPSMKIILKNNRTIIGFSFSILHSESICSSESHWIIMKSVESQSPVHLRLLIIPAIRAILFTVLFINNATDALTTVVSTNELWLTEASFAVETHI